MDITNTAARGLTLAIYPSWMEILLNPLRFEWSVQGLGMLRTYIDETKRLHIWHSAIRDPKASPVHNHPWDLESYVLWGHIRQYRLKESPMAGTSYGEGDRWNKQLLHCGEGGGLLDGPEEVRLIRQPIESYSRKMKYAQRANEIHWSQPEDNTVTIVTRHVPGDGNPDQAAVYWPIGTEWGSAEPRPASNAEVLYVTQSVLNNWQLSGTMRNAK